MSTPCTCCAAAGASAALAAYPAAAGAQAAARWRHAVCGRCLAWLAGVVEAAAAGTEAPVPGAPISGGRAALFPEQCHLCRALVRGGGSVVLAEPGDARWRGMLACVACATWVGTLASDARSLRGRAARAADGGAGIVPHPRLAGTAVAVDLAPGQVRGDLTRACVEAGVEMLPRGLSDGADVVFAGAGAIGIGREVARWRERGGAAVLLAGPRERDRLLEGLAAGAYDWLTLPVTPHQAVTAMARVAAGVPGAGQWDEQTCLPVVGPRALPEGLRVEPRAGIDPFAAAWLVRRFARGYDRAVSCEGEIVLLPHAPPGALPLVAARLGRALRGHCRVSVVGARAERRFEAAG